MSIARIEDMVATLEGIELDTATYCDVMLQD